MTTPASAAAAPKSLASLFANSNPVAPASSAAAGTTLDSTQFLQLMTTQLKNQDPTQPLDPSQFVSQLAQLSQVSAVTGMQSSIASLVSSLSASQLLNGSALVGKNVMANGSSVNLGASGGVTGGVQVPTGSTAVQVGVLDASGQLIQQIDVNPTAGNQQFAWDGSTAAGTRAPPGSYTFEAIGASGGQHVSLQTEVSTLVQSVSVDSATNALMLNTADLGSIPVSSVTQVY